VKKPLELWATCLGTGNLAFPGLFGSLGGLILAVALNHFLSSLTTFVVALVFTIISWSVLARFSPDLFRNDPHRVVIDECCGFFLIGAFLSAWWLVAALLIFRILDNVKPFPARRLERLSNEATAVFADDLAMALYTGLIMVAVIAL
jgi:phosphatidylglycerophosphatase A